MDWMGTTTGMTSLVCNHAWVKWILFIECYISTYARCAMFFPAIFSYLCQLCQAVTTCAGYVDCYTSTYASCDDLCQVCGLLYFYLCQLHQVLFFYYISTVPGCDDLCGVCGLLYFYLYQLWRPVPGKQRVIFLPMPAVPGTLVLFFYSEYARLWRPVPGMWIVIFLFVCQLWRPVPGIQSVMFPPMPAAPDAPSFVFLPIPTVPGYDDLCRVCGLLYFYLCQLWQPLLGMWIVVFLPMPAAPGAPSFIFLPIPTVPGFDNLCRVCGLLYFCLCQLW